MKLTRTELFLLGVLIMIVLSPIAFTQFRGGPGGGGGKSGKMRGPNAEDLFSQLSGGKDSFSVSSVQIPEMWTRFGESAEKQKEGMMSFLQRKGVSNGTMTLALYKEYSETRMNDRFFGMYSGDPKAESFNVDKVNIPFFMLRGTTAEQAKEKMKEFLKKKGVNNGEMTKALFSEYQTEARAAREKERDQNPGGPAPGGSKGPGGPGSDTKANDDKTLERAKEAFARFDTNKDNVLDDSEIKTMSSQGSRLAGEKDKYDKNKNGKIEFDEYLEYYKARFSRGGSGGNRGPDRKNDQQPETKTPTIEDTRPTVYRLGKMPKELPTWYEPTDKDKDGQVGLYEWRAEGKSVKDFLAMDTNNDGFVTVEEMLRFQKVEEAKKNPSLTGTFASLVGPQPAQGTPLVGMAKENGGGKMGGRMGGGMMPGGKMGGGIPGGKMGGWMGRQKGGDQGNGGNGGEQPRRPKGGKSGGKRGFGG